MHFNQHEYYLGLSTDIAFLPFQSYNIVLIIIIMYMVYMIEMHTLMYEYSLFLQRYLSFSYMSLIIYKDSDDKRRYV